MLLYALQTLIVLVVDPPIDPIALILFALCIAAISLNYLLDRISTRKP